MQQISHLDKVLIIKNAYSISLAHVVFIVDEKFIVHEFWAVCQKPSTLKTIEFYMLNALAYEYLYPKLTAFLNIIPIRLNVHHNIYNLPW